jgi:hypothetical protein
MLIPTMFSRGRKDRDMTKNFVQSLQDAKPSLAGLRTKPGLTAKEKAEKALARRLAVEQRKNDIPRMVTAWLVGVNKDLRKAPECRCLNIIDLTLVI